MKILILNGSPRRKGNTRAALQVMEEQLKQEHEVEFLDVCSLHLSGCRACDACKKNGGHCICPDDSDLVVQKISDADVLLFGTPVYSWSISAQLKMVIDKMYSRDGVLASMPKKVGMIVVGADALDGPQYRLIQEQFNCLTDAMHWNFVFYLPFSAFKAGDLEKQEGYREKLLDTCTSFMEVLRG